MDTDAWIATQGPGDGTCICQDYCATEISDTCAAEDGDCDWCKATGTNCPVVYEKCRKWDGSIAQYGTEESLKQFIEKIKNRKLFESGNTPFYLQPLVLIVAEFALKNKLFGGFSFHFGSSLGKVPAEHELTSWNYPKGGRCRIASITKPVIAAIAHKYLNVSLRVDYYYPQLKDSNIAHLTIKSLITHTSGITKEMLGKLWSGTNWPEVYDGRRFPDFMKAVFTNAFELNPDPGYSYCNWNYILLGNILEFFFEKLPVDVTTEVKNLLSDRADFGLNYQALEDEVQSFATAAGEEVYLIEDVKYCGGLVVPPEDLLNFAQNYILNGWFEGEKITSYRTGWHTHNGSVPGSYTILTQYLDQAKFLAPQQVISFVINFRQRYNKDGILVHDAFEGLNKSIKEVFKGATL